MCWSSFCSHGWWLVAFCGAHSYLGFETTSTQFGSNSKNSFDVLIPLFTTTTDGYRIGGAGSMISVRYAQDTPDPIINAGLPSSTDFVVDAAGSEINGCRPADAPTFSEVILHFVG
jgi:hypothetical protein